MGFFTKDASGPQDGLAPLSRDRITACLEARGFNFGIDDDGDVGGVWDGHLFYFFVLGQSGEYLQSRGRWNRVLGVYAEHTVDYEHGVSDQQVDLHLACSITTGLQLFEHLDESYPEQAAAAKAQQEQEGE